MSMNSCYWIMCVFSAEYRYFGLSSTGISHKSSASAFGSSSFGSSGSYGGMSSTREGDRFGNSSKNEDDYFEFKKQNQGSKGENQEYTSRQVSTDIGRLDVIHCVPRLDSLQLERSF